MPPLNETSEHQRIVITEEDGTRLESLTSFICLLQSESEQLKDNKIQIEKLGHYNHNKD